MEENHQDFEQPPDYRLLAGELKAIGSGIGQLLQNALPEVDRQIDHLISTRSRDLKQIEYLLDTLTDWRIWGVGGEHYIRLVEYLKTFEPDLAAYYWQQYDQPDPYSDLHDLQTGE